MNERLQPGNRGEPLPAGETVLRFLKASLHGRVTDAAFELTTLDKTSPLQSLSVWAARLTSPEQAREFLGDQKDASLFYCLLGVEEIRSLRLSPESPVTPLDVVWDPLFLSNSEERDSRPGAEGHAGITGLVRPPGMEKLLYKRLRVQLADLANKRLHTI